MTVRDYLPAEQIPLFKVHMPKEAIEAVSQTLGSGYIGQGPKVEEFEKKLAIFFENRNVVTVNSGTSALTLALRLAEVEGGEVITTPMTCMATNTPILDNRATPVWADVDADTGLIDPLDVERKVTARTKAIMCVHWGGTPCDMESLRTIADEYNLKLIEDAAHAFGSTYAGRKIGNATADFSCFSFQAIKHITTVDGGLLMCRSTEDYKQAKLLRWYGIDREGDRKDFRCEEDVLDWGYKFHMNDVAATIGIVQLDYIQTILAKHRSIAAYYHAMLDPDRYEIQHSARGGDLDQSAWWLYTLLLRSPEVRDQFMLHMKNWGIQTSRVHAPNDLHTVYAELQRPLPGVRAFEERMVCIPIHYGIGENERKRIVDAANSFARRDSVPQI